MKIINKTEEFDLYHYLDTDAIYTHNLLNGDKLHYRALPKPTDKINQLANRMLIDDLIARGKSEMRLIDVCQVSGKAVLVSNNKPIS